MTGEIENMCHIILISRLMSRRRVIPLCFDRCSRRDITWIKVMWKVSMFMAIVLTLILCLSRPAMFSIGQKQLNSWPSISMPTY